MCQHVTVRCMSLRSIEFHSQAAGQKQGDMPLVAAVRTIFSGSLNSVLHLLQVWA